MHFYHLILPYQINLSNFAQSNFLQADNPSISRQNHDDEKHSFHKETKIFQDRHSTTLASEL